jgi:DNA-binding beta-propeller fold protein YncE
MTRAAAALLVVATIAGIGMLECSRSGGQPQSFPARFAVLPKDAKVFAGDTLQFRTSLVGDAAPAAIAWSVVGPGSVNASGAYESPALPATAEVVADAGHGITDASSVATVRPPSAGVDHLLSTCYDDGTVSVFDARARDLAGAFSIGAHAAGIIVDRTAQRALVAADDRLFAVDLRSMRWQASAPVPGARLSEVAELAYGYVAATDNLASPETGGVRIFRINSAGVPQLVSSARAGDTPEGIAATVDHKTFFVTAINSNTVTRFAIDRSGVARRTGVATTATRPFGVAVDERHQLLFVADNDTPRLSGARANPGLERFSLTSMHRIGDVISMGSKAALPLGVVVDHELSRLFVTNEGLANVNVFSIPSMRRIATLDTDLTPWLPYLDEAAHRLYVPNARANTVAAFDTRALHEAGPRMQTCAYPTAVTVWPKRKS